MKKVRLISLALSMPVCFVLKAQEKVILLEHLDTISKEIKTNQAFTYPKDSIKNINVSSNFIQPTTSTKKIIICAPSKSTLIEPLYIIDGIIVNSNQLSKVNPNDIENIKVLKGTEATSLYGNQGRNGVVIVTTKEKD